MRILNKILALGVLSGFILFAAMSMGEENKVYPIPPLQHKSITLSGLVENQTGPAKKNPDGSRLKNVIDELNDLISNPNKQGTDSIQDDRIQKKIQELNRLIEKQKIDIKRFTKKDFDNSICFRQCHKKNAFTPADKSRSQWQLLIGKNGHAIFEKIPWESPYQKQQVLYFLLKHAGGTGKEGIGVWD